jgi:hypothetical protein
MAGGGRASRAERLLEFPAGGDLLGSIGGFLQLVSARDALPPPVFATRYNVLKKKRVYSIVKTRSPNAR